MGRKERDKTDKPTTDESRQATPVESGNNDLVSKYPPNQTNRAPDLRRRALIAGLATTPILLSLTNRSALAQDINCSALASVILGGSAAYLPPGLGGQGGENNNVPDHALQNMYDAKCKNEAHGGNTNGNSNGTINGNRP